ncbi:LytTR family DNA-binding domain-containing protein [candidate division KSB1 bacterium]|nr:LytTR family DNA-binding domain-containing protein [candidate division KSB1 bacterium]
MPKIKVIIIDDEPLGRQLIREYLANPAFPQIEIKAECADAHAALDAIEQYTPDLIFLDIQMPEINGFELLAMLETPPKVIFSTAYDQYALQAFEVNAVDYLLKPYDFERFQRALERALQTLPTDSQNTASLQRLLKTIESSPPAWLERFLIKQAGRIVIISCREIQYIQALDDYVEIFVQKDSYLIQHPMNQLELRLNPNQFVRIHRSYIVNLDAIRDIVSWNPNRYQVILKNGKELFISRSGIQKLKRFTI